MIALILAMSGCGSSSTNPETGPAFSSLSPTPSATDLWWAISFEPYLASGGNIDSGDVKCELSGSMHVEQHVGSTSNSRIGAYTYSKCKYTAQFFTHPPISSVQNLKLAATGEVNGSTVLASSNSNSCRVSMNLDQHISYSGDLGFSQDCNFSVTYDSNCLPSTYSGSCAYTDSSGQQLTITGEEMTKAVQAAIAMGI